VASSDFAALLRAQLSEFVAKQFAADASPDASDSDDSARRRATAPAE
jgi:hypothetical protein